MAYQEWIDFIGFVERMLYMYIAFMCGLIIGYIVGFRNGSD